MEIYGITGFNRDGGRVCIPNEFAKELRQAARVYGCRVSPDDLSGSELFVPEPRRPTRHANIRGGYDWSRCRAARDNYRWIYKWLVSQGVARRHLDVDGLPESVAFLASFYVGGGFERSALALLLLDMNDYAVLSDCIVDTYPAEVMLNDPDAAYLLAAAKDVRAMCQKYFKGFGPEYKAPGVGLHIAGDHCMLIPSKEHSFNYTRSSALGGSWLYGPEPLEGESARDSVLRRRDGRLRALVIALCGSYMVEMNEAIAEPERRRKRLQIVAINRVIPNDLSKEDMREVERIGGDLMLECGEVEGRLKITREGSSFTPKQSSRVIDAVMNSISEIEGLDCFPIPVPAVPEKPDRVGFEKEALAEISSGFWNDLFEKAGMFDTCGDEEVEHPDEVVVVCGVVPERLDVSSVGFTVKAHGFAEETPSDAACVITSSSSVVISKPPSGSGPVYDSSHKGCRSVIKGRVASLVVWAASLGRNRSDPSRGGNEDFVDVLSDPVSGFTSSIIMYGDPAKVRCTHVIFDRAAMQKHLIDNMGLGTAEAGVLSRAFDLYRVNNLGGYTITPRSVWRTEEYPVEIFVYFGPYPVFGGKAEGMLTKVGLYLAQCLTVIFRYGDTQAVVAPRSTLKLNELQADLGMELGYRSVNSVTKGLDK